VSACYWTEHGLRDLGTEIVFLTCHYMYHQFNIKQFCALPTQCIYVFCVDLRTNSDYFPLQHYLTDFYNGDLNL